MISTAKNRIQVSTGKNGQYTCDEMPVHAYFTPIRSTHLFHLHSLCTGTLPHHKKRHITAYFGETGRKKALFHTGNIGLSKRLDDKPKLVKFPKVYAFTLKFLGVYPQCPTLAILPFKSIQFKSERRNCKGEWESSGNGGSERVNIHGKRVKKFKWRY